MNRSEIHFWRQQANKGRLLEAVRIDRQRARRFFGATDVRNEDELQLLYTLDAYEVSATPQPQLELEVSNWARITTSDVRSLPANVSRPILASQKSPKQLAAQLKARALRVVRAATTRRK